MTKTRSDLKRFAGLDIAKESIYCCIVDHSGFKTDKRFDTKTSDLIELEYWLINNKVSEVALENTGIYSEPISNVLKKNLS